MTAALCKAVKTTSDAVSPGPCNLFQAITNYFPLLIILMIGEFNYILVELELVQYFDMILLMLTIFTE